jgi:hypothetical protein
MTVKRLAALGLLFTLACDSAPASQPMPMAAATGGSGTGLAQDATLQQINALFGASIPVGGSGTGLCQDASLQALYNLIAGGSPGTPVTAATVIGGQTYNLLVSDGVIRFDTSNNLGTATADMHAGAFIGQTVTFYWWAWSSEAGQPVPPTVVAPAGGIKMVGYGGQATSGAAGLVTSSAITTPGSSYTLKWDGTEWATP